MDKYKILVVDDEEDLCEILQFNLELEGYTVHTAHSAEEALKMPLATYHLLLLDVMMGEISGFKMARMLKAQPETEHLPIIFLTAKDTENDLVTGFGIGAEDYITKPFSIREVALRVKAVLRRTQKPTSEKILVYNTLQLMPESKKVMVDAQEIALTKKEFEILRLLLENKNKVFSREEILTKVWSDDVCVIDRTVDVNITRMRKKIGSYGSNIVTRQGYGYTFDTRE